MIHSSSIRHYHLQIPYSTVLANAIKPWAQTHLTFTFPGSSAHHGVSEMGQEKEGWADTRNWFASHPGSHTALRAALLRQQKDNGSLARGRLLTSAVPQSCVVGLAPFNMTQTQGHRVHPSSLQVTQAEWVNWCWHGDIDCYCHNWNHLATPFTSDSGGNCPCYSYYKIGIMAFN